MHPMLPKAWLDSSNDGSTFFVMLAYLLRGATMNHKALLRLWVLLCVAFCASIAHAEVGNDYQLGAGDIIRINVFQNPDLSMEARISESGIISYPLIGNVELGGMAIGLAEQKITKLLKSGGFVQQPQVNILVKQINGNLVSVLGQVNKPGRYPLETFNMKVSDILASAGGVAGSGSDMVVMVGVRDGKSFRKEIDIASMYLDNKLTEDVLVHAGDSLYVHRAPMFYVYGQAQRPGSYRVEKNMTVMQALAQGGGPSMRGTERGLKIYRRDNEGKTEEISPELTSPINADDVLYVRESLF